MPAPLCGGKFRLGGEGQRAYLEEGYLQLSETCAEGSLLHSWEKRALGQDCISPQYSVMFIGQGRVWNLDPR